MTRKTAFTLVELLVVIGIISVLISMLLPALNKAREAARSVQDKSNLRQITQAMMMYADENQGYFPPAAPIKANGTQALNGSADQNGTNFNSDSNYWQTILALKGYLPPKQMAWPYDQAGADWRIFTDPDAPNIDSSDSTYNIPGWYNQFISYGYNWCFIGSHMLKDDGQGYNAFPGTDVEAAKPAKVTQIRHPQETILLADTVTRSSIAGDGGAPWGGPLRGYFLLSPRQSRYTSGYGAPAAPRHSGYVNVAWVDGHVSSVGPISSPSQIYRLYDDNAMLRNGDVLNNPWDRD